MTSALGTAKVAIAAKTDVRKWYSTTWCHSRRKALHIHCASDEAVCVASGGFASRSGERLANRNALGQSDGNRRCWTHCRSQGLMLRGDGELAGGDYGITAAND